MNFPASVTAVVKAASAKHPDDTPSAVDWALRRIRALDEFDDLIDTFLKQAIQDLIYDARHNENRQIRNASGRPELEPKVDALKSASVHAVSKSQYDYFVAGRTLGSILGSDLRGIAEDEASTGEGYQFRARLLDKLADVVPAKKTVREAVSKTRLAKIWAAAEGDTVAA